jgi:hypothetical protein
MDAVPPKDVDSPGGKQSMADTGGEVVNFLNKANAADVRVYQLLAEKFKLFDGVFGASDEVIGAIESGVEFEKRIVAIYQQCRTSGQRLP